MAEWLDGFELLLSVFDRLDIGYMVGGSLASSAAGIWRSTQDIDIVAALSLRQIDLLVEALGNEFYVDAETAREAVESGRAFNLIHYGSSFKFDVFPLIGNPYYVMEFSRRMRTEVRMAPDRVLSFWAATPEDVILAKLVWYRTGGEVSERQWSDVRGVIAVQGERLERTYLNHWADRLGVRDLLVTAFGEPARD